MTAMIRMAQPEDLAALAALHSVCFSEHWSALGLGELMALPGTFGLVADEAGGIRGFALARIAADEAEVLTLAVHPAWRRQGLGRELVAETVRLASARGGHEMFLEVAAANFAARELYAAFGFQQAGLRKGYYEPGLKGDALILRRPLPLAPIGETG